MSWRRRSKGGNQGVKEPPTPPVPRPGVATQPTLNPSHYPQGCGGTHPVGGKGGRGGHRPSQKRATTLKECERVGALFTLIQRVSPARNTHTRELKLGTTPDTIAGDYSRFNAQVLCLSREWVGVGGAFLLTTDFCQETFWTPTYPHVRQRTTSSSSSSFITCASGYWPCWCHPACAVFECRPRHHWCLLPGCGPRAEPGQGIQGHHH